MLKDLELSTGAVGLGFLVLFLITFGIVWYFRSHFKNANLSNLTEKYKDTKWSSPLESRTKYPDVDSFKYSGPLLRYGLVAALASTLLAFSWTQYEKKIYIPSDALAMDEILEVEPPRTAEPPPPPPPPPPPVIEEVPDEEVIKDDQPKMEDMSVEVETKVEEVKREEKPAPPPPPPPPPPKPKEEEIFKVVEQMPRFPGCEDMAGDNKAKEDCAKQKMLEYIYKNIKYPAIARENGIEGSAVVQFKVDKDGSITDVEILRDPGAGLGDVAKSVIQSMNNMSQKWTPGKQRGRPVRVLYTLPVKFKLEG